MTIATFGIDGKIVNQSVSVGKNQIDNGISNSSSANTLQRFSLRF